MPDEALISQLEPLLHGLSAAAKEKARRFRKVEEVPIEELATHPDLGERLLEIGKSLDGVESGIFYKLFALRLKNGPIFALARGTHSLSFRVGESSRFSAGEVNELLGPEWINYNAWNANVRTAEWLAELTRAAQAAKEFVSESQ